MQRIILLFVLLTIGGLCFGQKKNKNAGSLVKARTSQQAQFLKKQWWIGFRAGGNLSQADPIKRYTILTPTNYSPALANKKYDNFNALGGQASVEISFQYDHFIFSTQPTYRQSSFTYSNQFSYVNIDDVSQSLIQNYKQVQKINYADIPLIIKYSFFDGNVKPYVYAGIYYSYLINASQTVTVSGTDAASGASNSFTGEPVIVGAKDLFANYWSLGIGAGLTWQLGNVQLLLDASYKKGMSNITNIHNRYSNDRLSGIGDVQDDVKLNSIVLSAGVLFPMRFLNTNFKSLQH